MSIYLEQAKLLLNNSGIDSPAIKEAQESLSNLIKKGSLIDNPTLQNAINLLTPFLVNYKINQVLKLLKELAKESKPLVDPHTGLKTYF